MALFGMSVAAYSHAIQTHSTTQSSEREVWRVRQPGSLTQSHIGRPNHHIKIGQQWIGGRDEMHRTLTPTDSPSHEIGRIRIHTITDRGREGASQN
mmetsp:Transcript_14488/g.34585  ORF Transcript_14488/g.34585 Transcript_14488/m.34585 type:complete len:96 (+) Transcript_14488:109-396(+)